MGSIATDLLQAVEETREGVIALTKRLIQAETVNTGEPDSGHEDLVADIIEDVLGGSHVELRRYSARPGRANVLARLPGRKRRLGLAYMAHSDVVAPGRRENWSHAPFSGEIKDGRMYGRGAADMKGFLAAEVMALKLWSELGIVPEEDLLLICAADEENGGTYGMKFLTEQHRDEVQAQWAVNEGGSLYRFGGEPTFGIGLGDKGRWQATFKVSGRSAHASRPWNGENVLYLLSKVLEDIQNIRWPQQFQLRFFRDVKTLLGWEEEITAATFAGFLERLEKEGGALADTARALAVNTIAPTMVDAGIGSNVVPDAAVLTCDVRLLPGADLEKIADTLQAIADKYPGVELDVFPTAHASISPASDPFFQSVQEATRIATGARPQFIGSLSSGFTDARFLRGLGVTVYNYAPVSLGHNPALSRIHGPDESIALEDLMVRTKFYAILPTILPGMSSNGGN